MNKPDCPGCRERDARIAELEARVAELEQLRRERARYESERAARQYQACEPENRLVGRELERRWEEALKAQRQVEDESERWRRSAPGRLSPDDEAAIRSLAADLSSGVLLGWNGDGHTAYGEGSSCVDTIVNAYLISLKVPRSGTLCP